MAQSVQLPDGSWFPLKQGESPQAALEEAAKLYPDAFGIKPKEAAPKEDTKGFKAAAAAGFERLKGETALTAGKLGLMGIPEAEKYQKEKEAAAQARFTPTEEGWTESPWQKLKETAGGSLPYMVAPAAAGLAALAAPAAIPAAALGAGAAGLTSAAQFTGTNLARQMDTGKTLEQTSLGSAVGAAIPQAALDTAAMALLPGVGKLFGSVGSKLTTEEARAIASQTLGKTLQDYAVKTGGAMSREGLTESVQQVLERLQAGLNITDPEARKEYIDSFIGGAALGAVGAPVGRYMERGAAQTQAAEADKAERLKAAEEQAKQTRLAAEQETARKGTPEYALDVAKQLADLEQAKLDLQSKIRKVTANSPTEAEDKAHNAEIRAQLKENYKARTPLGEEKSRLEKTGIYQQAMEQERVKNMTPEDYMLSDLEAARANASAPRKRGAWQTSEADFAPAPTQTREARLQQEKEQFELNQIADVRGYAQERLSLAKDQLTLPNAQEYAEYLVQDPAKALQLLNSRSKTLPGLNPQTTAQVYKALRESTALQQYRDQQKAMYAQRVSDVQAQLANGEIDNEQANAYLEQLDIAARDRSEGRTQRDIEAVEKQAAMPTATTTQGELFGGAEQRVNMPQTGTRADIDAQIAELERQLDVAKSHGAPTALDRRSNRERISDIMHQLRDLRERQAKIASGAPMGVKSDAALSAYVAAGTPDRKPGESIEDWYARTEQVVPTTSGLPEQEKAAQARRDAVDLFAQKDSSVRNGLGATAADVDAAKQGVVAAMLKEISDVRGKLKPETITAIEKEVRQLLDNKMMFGQDYGSVLDAISNRWRAGVRRGTYGDTQATPTQTSAGMLHAQMERAFAQREKYSPEDMTLLERIADSFKAFIADPERRNMAGEWLNRVTTTGSASPAMARDLQEALHTLESGKISETEKGRTAVQGELDAELMPEAVAPQSETHVVNGKVQYVAPEDKGPLQGSAAERYAPMQKGTIFNTPEELDAYLASDYLKEARENQGLARDTVARLSKQVAAYETEMTALQKRLYDLLGVKNTVSMEDLQTQLDALQERKETLKGTQQTERRTADNIIADAETHLTDLLQQMEADLGPIRLSLEQAEINLAAAEARSEETSRLIANNVANFTQMDDKVVRAAQATAAAKAELRQARNKLGSLEEKRPAIEAAQRKVIDALQRQRNPLLYEMQEKMQDLQAKLAKARENQPRTAARLEQEIAELEDMMDMQRDNPYVPSSAMVTFLNNDLQLQMDAREDRAKIGAAKRSIDHFQKKLDKAKSDLDVTKSTKPEIKALQEQISTAKELGTDALRGVEGEMALLDDEIEKLQGAQQAVQRQANNIEDQIIAAGEERTFAGQLASTTPETLSALDRAETLAKDKKALEDFQGRTERLNALPGQRIDFSKRREMLELVKASTEDFAKLDADIEAMEDGIDFLHLRDYAMHEELMDMQEQAVALHNAPFSKEATEHFAKMEEHKKKMAENKTRIQSLRDSITQYEKTRATKQAALAKAERATSSDPEVAAEVTKEIDRRMTALDKTVERKKTAMAEKGKDLLQLARDIKAKAEAGKTPPEQLEKMRERLKTLRASQADRSKHYKEALKEREVLKARRSNRLGITRTLANMDALKEELATAEARLRTVASTINSTSATKQEKAAAQVEAATLTESVADLRKRTATKPKKAGITEQEQFDAELERVQALGVAKDRLAEMEKGMAALQKAKEPKTEAKKAERAERIAKLQADINKQLALVDSLTPKEMGAVSQATKTETVAPAKLRAGTPESKENVGISHRPIVETRTGKAPTATQAVADANEFAERLQAAKTPAELDADFAAKSVETQNQIIEAVEGNIARFRTQADALANELLDLNSISAKDTTPQIAARKEKVRDDLSYAERMLDGAMRDHEHLLAEQEKADAQTEEVGGVDAFMKDLSSGTAPSTGEKGLVMRNGVELDIEKNTDAARAATIKLVRTLNKRDLGLGKARDALQFVTDLADKHGITLTLQVEPVGKGGLNAKQLEAWYARSGFESSDVGMTRLPETQELPANYTAFNGQDTIGNEELDPDAQYRVADTTGPSMSTAQVQKAYDALTSEWVNKPTVVVVADERGLPVRFRNQAERDKMTGKIPGLYDPKAKKVYLVASNLRSVRDVIMTVTHEVAGHFGLQSVLGETYNQTMNDIYKGNDKIRRAADAKIKQIPTLSRETAVEEALAEQAEMDPNAPDTRPAMRRVYEAVRKFFRDVLGMKDTFTDAQINQLIANARHYVIQGGEAGKGVTGQTEATYRSTNTEALESLASKAIATPKTLREKMGSNIALEAEMQAVDMRAGVREALKAASEMVEGSKNFAQAMYAVLKSDQKMAMVYTIMERGPLEMYRDAKGLLGYRSTNKNSAKDVFAAIGDLPVPKEKRMAIAQAYLVAQRATNKGAGRLDTGALGISEEDVAAALAAAKADSALGAALERVRSTYNAFNKGLIDFMVEAKAISKELGAKLNKDGDYVPFYRVNNDGTADLVFGADENAFVSVGDIRRQPYLAQLKGGETKLLPLDEALTRNTMLLTDKALTNMATKEVAYGLQAIGKPVDKMQIHKGHGPAGSDIIRFMEEPDPADDKDKGQRWLKVDTATTVADGVPSALLVKSLEGAHMPLPAFLKLAGAASDLLRAGVTRTPLYIARQLLRDPMAASFTGGLNYNAFTAVLKAGKEYVRMIRGNSANEAKLLEKGLIQSGIFHGGVEDVSKLALQMVGSKNQSAMNRIFAAADKAAMRADATTRALVYENAIKNGLSEVEADMMTMESMNFYKRGLSPSVQYASRLIPFLNAQIQGLNVLYKAATGKMPFEEQQQIKRKFLNNAALLTVTGIAYAMAMEDDETFKNARPRDKYSNFFLPIPGVDEPLKLPIPYEAGFFYSLAVAAVDGMRAETDGKEQWKALKDMFIGAIPGASSMVIPQIAKPAFEVWADKNFLSGGTIEPMSLSHVNAEERYTANTTELAKAMGKVLPLSPIQIEHLVRGYLGVLPLAAAGAANDLFAREGKGEQADKRMSERSLIGSAFQKKHGGADNDVVFRIAHEATEAKSTLAKMVSEGRREDAVAYREEHRAELMSASAAGQYRQLVGRINADARRTNERGDLSASEKRARLDMLEEHKQRAAENFLKLVKRVEDSQR